MTAVIATIPSAANTRSFVVEARPNEDAVAVLYLDMHSYGYAKLWI